jgi:hypothetical protein
MTDTLPARVRLSRTKGFRLQQQHPGAYNVARPGPFGNPFIVGTTTPADWHEPFAGLLVRDRAHAVELLCDYLAWRSEQPAGWSSSQGPYFPWESQIRSVLAGRDLACWCPPGEWCHADVLIEIANSADLKG